MRFVPFLLIAAALLPAADFLVLDDPPALSLYNRFQEPFSDAEKSALLPMSPVRILETSALLGDQITPALKGDLQGTTVYIRKETDGRFQGLRDQNRARIYRGCTPLGDTVELTFQGGGRVVRIFTANGRTLALRLSGERRYEWLVLGAGSWRKPSTAVVADTALPGAIVTQIRDRLAAADRAYALWFGHFNAMTRQDLSLPRWRLEPGPVSLRCVLQGPPHYRDALARSSARLVEDIDGMLIGRPFSARLERGDIVVEGKPDHGGHR